MKARGCPRPPQLSAANLVPMGPSSTAALSAFASVRGAEAILYLFFPAVAPQRPDERTHRRNKYRSPLGARTRLVGRRARRTRYGSPAAPHAPKICRRFRRYACSGLALPDSPTEPFVDEPGGLRFGAFSDDPFCCRPDPGTRPGPPECADERSPKLRTSKLPESGRRRAVGPVFPQDAALSTNSP